MFQPIKYLHWAKTHARARYELTVSGIRQVTAEEWSIDPADLELTIRGAYGHAEFVERVASLYGVDPGQVLPVTGTSTANFVAVACAAERGQTVLVERPAYEPLVRVIEFLGLRAASFRRDPDYGFAPDLDDIRRGLDEGARAVLMSDLHNPSGRRCSGELMRAIAELCRSRSATLIVDEVYRDFAVIQGLVERGTAAAIGPQVIATSSLTKAYGFGGLRAGWMIASRESIEKGRAVFDHLCVDVPAPSAAIATAVLKDIDRWADRTRRIYDENAPVLMNWCDAHRDWTRCGHDGAPFVLLGLPAGIDADGFCRRLYDSFDTRVVSGAFFDMSHHVRVSFSVPKVDLIEGLERLDRCVRAILAEC